MTAAEFTMVLVAWPPAVLLLWLALRVMARPHRRPTSEGGDALRGAARRDGGRTP